MSDLLKFSITKMSRIWIQTLDILRNINTVITSGIPTSNVEKSGPSWSWSYGSWIITTYAISAYHH